MSWLKNILPSFFGAYEYNGINVIPAFELIAQDLLNEKYNPSIY